MFERIPYAFDILTVVVICHLCWSWWCCRKASRAYAGVDHLFTWAEKMANLLKAVGECSGCTNADPTWPPDDPGDFPEDF